MDAAGLSLRIQGGATFHRRLEFSTSSGPWSLVGYQALLQIREKPGAPVIVELSTENGRIVIPATAPHNALVLALSPAETGALNFPVRGLAMYDLLLIAPDGTRYRPFEGPVRYSSAISSPS